MKNTDVAKGYLASVRGRLSLMGVRQNVFARNVGICPAYICQILRGNMIPSHRMATKILKVLRQMEHAYRKGRSQSPRMDIYDSLRDMHSILKAKVLRKNVRLSTCDLNAIEAVHSVLYLAEGVFATENEQ